MIKPTEENAKDSEERLAITIFKGQNFGKEPTAEDIRAIQSRFRTLLESGGGRIEEPIEEAPNHEEPSPEKAKELDPVAIEKARRRYREKKLELDALSKEVGVNFFLVPPVQWSLSICNAVMKVLTLGKVDLWRRKLDQLKKLRQLEWETLLRGYGVLKARGKK